MHTLHTALEETMAEAVSLNRSWPSLPYFKVNTNNSFFKYENVRTNDRRTGQS